MQPANFLCNIVLLVFHSPGQNQRLSYREDPQLINRNACDCLVSMDKEGPRISGSCIARYLDPSKNIISPVVPQNEANCVNRCARSSRHPVP